MTENLISLKTLCYATAIVCLGLAVSNNARSEPSPVQAGIDGEVPGTTSSNPSDRASNLPNLSAKHIRRHEASGIVLMRAAIELSPQGIRVRQSLHGERHREMLQDFVSNEAWLIDHKRSIVHRLPLEDDDEDIGIRPGDTSSFLGQEPCGVLLSQVNAGKGIWRGRDVHAWHCTDTEGEIVNIEFVDDVYGIVVFQSSADGLVNELKDLKNRSFPNGHFRPNERLRSVSRQEFFGGAPNIPRYIEAD